MKKIDLNQTISILANVGVILGIELNPGSPDFRAFVIEHIAEPQ